MVNPVPRSDGGAVDVEQLKRDVAAIDWWHEIDLGHGIVTPGRGGARERLSNMRMPADLTGKTVLDIGAFDGLFSFEAERRGAKRVVAMDHRVPPGFRVAHRALRSGVEFVEADIMELTPQSIGTFDIVFFLGVIYHLPDPMGALRRVYDLTKDLMILETDSALYWIEEPAAECRGSRAALNDTALNWWIPNTACMLRMIDAVGFSRAEPVFGPPPPPRDPVRKALRRLFPYRNPPKSTRLIIHAWK